LLYYDHGFDDNDFDDDNGDWIMVIVMVVIRLIIVVVLFLLCERFLINAGAGKPYRSPQPRTPIRKPFAATPNTNPQAVRLCI